MSRLGMVTFLYYPMLFLPCGVSHQGCLLELPRELLKLPNAWAALPGLLIKLALALPILKKVP